MRYIHILTNHAVVQPFINLVNENFTFKEHTFFIVGGISTSKLPIPVNDNVYVIDNFKAPYTILKLLLQLQFCHKIFIHGLFSHYLLLLLRLNPWVLKKTNWLIWGGDLYQYKQPRISWKSKIVEGMRAYIIKRVSEVSSSLKGDFYLAKKWYGAKGTFRKVMYSFPLQVSEIQQILEQDTFQSRDTVNIMIGNSASKENQHFEVLDLLEKFKKENIRIYCPLSYGAPEDVEKVIKYGRNKFNEKFAGITEFVPYSEFVKFINNVDIVIFNHRRQQGFGNLLLALYLGKKVYFNRKSTLWELFDDYQILKTDELNEADFQSFIAFSHESAISNKKKIKALLAEDTLLSMWDSVFRVD